MEQKVRHMEQPSCGEVQEVCVFIFVFADCLNSGRLLSETTIYFLAQHGG